VHARLGARVDVQVLNNPDDLLTWVTIGSATVGEGGEWQLDARPVADAAQAARWPDGGLLRLRAVDDTGEILHVLDHDADACLAGPGAADPSLCASPFGVIVLVDPAPLPVAPMLTDKGIGSPAESAAYYVATDAPATLAEFMTRYGFGPTGAPLADELSATYLNEGDLGIGREMHCRALPGGGAACYVRNFGEFGGDLTTSLLLAEAGGVPLATVAMVVTPPIDADNAVRFMVYDGLGALSPVAQLDSRGDNVSVPQNCLECHGGRSTYDPALHAVKGARFLPFDPSAFRFSSGGVAAVADQQERLRKLNKLVLGASPPPGVVALVEGWYQKTGGINVVGSRVDHSHVPAGWATQPRDARVYKEVLATTCVGCHASFADTGGAPSTLAFGTPAEMSARGPLILTKTCGLDAKRMPAAEATLKRFWQSPARAYLVSWMGAAGACAPAPL